MRSNTLLTQKSRLASRLFCTLAFAIEADLCFDLSRTLSATDYFAAAVM